MNQNSNSLGIFTESITHVGCPNCKAELDVSEFEVFEEISCPSCGDKFQVPGRLGDFILIEELGRGAMGCVYLAMDESLNRLVALKVIRKEYGEDPKMLETVQREAQAMATLNHRNIVQVYSFGRVKEQPYFVMELLQGERLDEMMADGGIVSEIRALEIALDVANGLDAANQAGLTHGDIKPANILMNDQGVAKVVDFGLAKFMEPGAEIEVWGTPYYIAPEKARKKGEDSRSDQYSLGGTIFHALAGQPPFDGENPTKVVVAALKEDTPVLKEHNPEVTDKTSAVIRRMMDKSPNRRYPTYASLLADLSLALEEAKKAAEARQLEDQRLREKQNKKINPLVWIVMLVTLVVTAGIALFVWNQTRSPSGEGIIQYEGPARELHEPFSRAEIRNLEQAIASLSKKNFPEALERLSVAKNLIPENHSAMAWFHFLEASVYFYAQYPEEARESLEKAAALENPIFDARKPPEEDPRILAKYALGQLDERELERATRRTLPYFEHLAELARGYRYLINDQANQSARHFQYYSGIRSSNVDWPYLLHPITPVLHLPLEQLSTDKSDEEVVLTPGEQILSGLNPVLTPTPAPPEKKKEESRQNETSAPKDRRSGASLDSEKTVAPPATPEEKLLESVIVNWNFKKEGVLPEENVKGNVARVPNVESEDAALQFDGRTGRVEVPMHSQFSRQHISFAFRLFPESPDGVLRNIFTQKLIENGVPDENRSLFSIYADAKGELAVRIAEKHVNTGVPLPLKWFDLVITFNGTEPRNRLKVYLEGNTSPVWEGDLEGVTRIPDPGEVKKQSPDALDIGRWKGKIGAVVVYNRALEASEIPHVSAFL